MQKDRILQLIEQPLALQRETDLPLIKELTEEFPYFSAPYLLLTRHLSQNKSIYLDKYLKISAAYIGNRELLYNLIFEEAPETKTQTVENIDEQKTENHISGAEKMLSAETNTENEKANLENSVDQIDKPAELVSEVSEENEIASGEKASLINAVTENENHIELAEKMLSAETGIENADEKTALEASNSTENTETDKPRRKVFEGLEALPVAAYDYFAYQQKIAAKQKAEEEKQNPQNCETVKQPDSIENEPVEIKTEEFEINENTSLSFSDWLTRFSRNEITHVQKAPVSPKQAITPSISAFIKQEKRKPERADVENIITNFIRQEPKKIKPAPASFYKPEDFAQRSAEEDNTLVTETLANIYLKQGLKEKALEIFQQLIIKYPQKSSYFAAKIQEINTNQ